jgi:3-oxoacyl-[acyl-carrier protein] reductase
VGAGVVDALAADGWTVLAPPRADLDLADLDSIPRYLASVTTPIDGLVLNAGINSPAPLGELSMAAWQEIVGVNATASFALVSALCPGMAERGFGRVVAISSAYATRARTGRAAYSASKAALEGLIRTVAVEFAASGVIANCVAPGFVDTDLTRQNNTPEMIESLLERVPVGRLVSPAELGRAVAFLMSPDNAYITGQTLVVDGGFSCT